MPVVKLGARPKSFARTVTFKDVDGTELSVPITFKYRTRKEFGAWLDTLPPEVSTADGMTGEGDDKTFSAETYIAKVSERNTEKLMQCVEGWGLDVEFGRESVAQLCDEMPAAAEAILDDYKAAMLEGRLGN